MNVQRTNASGADDVRFQRYSAEEARQIRDTVQDIYERSYVDAIASGDPFDSVNAFMRRFDSYASNPSIDLVIAYQDDRAIGQTWGWPLTAQTGWWSGLLSEPDPDFTREDGHRTFALSEIMVIPECTGQGVAHALHDNLLTKRPEERATLLVEQDNSNAYRAYLHWGWRQVAQLCPEWEHAPTFDVLMLDLRR